MGAKRRRPRPAPTILVPRIYEGATGLYDLHEPYRDERAFSTALAFVRHVKPSRLIVGGDWLDCYSLSRFVSDPARKLALQDDLDACKDSLKRLRRAAPKARIWYLKGNHEARLQKYLWSRAPELERLRDLRLPRLLDLGSLGIEWVESGLLDWPGLVWKHGNIVRAKSGATATAELERLWRSGVSGHTHRLAQVFKRNKAGVYSWVEAGCLCGLDPEYGEGQTMDWQHGIVHAEVEQGRGNRFTVSPLPIVNGRVVFGGKEIQG